MAQHPWFDSLSAAITVCAADGTILEMNERAGETFAAEGGTSLVGSNVLDCHPPRARAKLEELLATRQANVYTIEKRGVRKLVHQAPWYEGGEYRGFVEIVLVLPDELPHFKRS